MPAVAELYEVRPLVRRYPRAGVKGGPLTHLTRRNAPIAPAPRASAIPICFKLRRCRWLRFCGPLHGRQQSDQDADDCDDDEQPDQRKRARSLSHEDDST